MVELCVLRRASHRQVDVEDFAGLDVYDVHDMASIENAQIYVPVQIDAF